METSQNTINCKGNLLNLNCPLVMGILNITPDSFYDGGAHNTSNKVLEKAKKMLDEGADIIDIGGYSSRPGAAVISEEEEIKRVIPIIETILKELPNTIISIDTFRSKVAKTAINAGAAIINDISAGDLDINMFETVQQLQVPYIIMHMKGNPQNMQEKPTYTNVVDEVLFYLSKKVNRLTEIGVNDVIIDPGFGFGKTVEHNYELLSKLNRFSLLGLPTLVGLSRKSMIYKKLDCTVAEALNGTTVLNTIALSRGANILRVHDVKEATETIQLWQAVDLNE